MENSEAWKMSSLVRLLLSFLRGLLGQLPTDAETLIRFSKQILLPLMVQLLLD
jgi:hypothetical protein